jgi:hypothetical protein
VQLQQQLLHTQLACACLNQNSSIQPCAHPCNAPVQPQAWVFIWQHRVVLRVIREPRVLRVQLLPDIAPASRQRGCTISAVCPVHVTCTAHNQAQQVVPLSGQTAGDVHLLVLQAKHQIGLE